MIRFTESDHLPREMCLLDLTGRVIKEFRIAKSNEANLSLADVEPGVYLLRHVKENGMMKKVVVYQEHVHNQLLKSKMLDFTARCPPVGR